MFELDQSIEVNGTTVRYAVNGQGSRHLMLVHGARAHQLWFYRMFEDLHRDWRVITVDLSGHGMSGHRAFYSVEQWSAELAAVLRAVTSEPAVVAGHSMGSRIAVALAANEPELVSELIMFDGNIRSPEKFTQPGERPAPTEPKYYESKDAAVQRFRLVPMQVGPDAEHLIPLAEYSAIQKPQGWSWRHDWKSPAEPYDQYINALVPKLTQPVRFVYGTASQVSGVEVAAYFVELATTQVEVIAIEGGGHHLMLDKPAECIAVIQGR